jgi:hypothetical protein
VSGYPLKGGYSATDPRLGRVPQFDARSRLYPIRELLPAGLRSRSWPCAVYLDQGQTPRCVGFAWSHELAAWPVVVRGVSDQLAGAVYLEAQMRDEWPGEDYEGSSVLGGAKAISDRGYMGEYRWAFGIDDVLATLSSHGPVILGTSWLEGMFDPDPDGLLSVTGEVAGGHAYLARGVILSGIVPGTSRKVGEPLVRIRNSWGRDWGSDSDAFVRASDLERLLGDEGEACVPVQRSA